jgi:hypothetical protein
VDGTGERQKARLCIYLKGSLVVVHLYSFPVVSLEGPSGGSRWTAKSVLVVAPPGSAALAARRIAPREAVGHSSRLW